MDDTTLVARLIGGDALAWEAFVRGHAVVLHATASRVLGPGRAADAEDVVQAVFAKLWEDDRRRLRGFRGTARVSTWLVAIAHREALDRLRSRAAGLATSPPPASSNGRAHPSAPEVAEAALSRDASPAVDSALAAREESASVHRAIDALPPRDRLLLRFVDLDGVPYAEVARLLAVPENSIGPWLRRARDRLREALGRPAGEAPEATPRRTESPAPPLQRDEVGRQRTAGDA